MEMGSPGLFYFLSFFFGSLLTAFATIYYDSLITQSLVFLGGTLAALGILKFWVRTRLQSTEKDHQTNVYALQGKHGIALSSITPEKSGVVKVGGEVWSARTIRSTISDGDSVKVTAIQGSHLIVEKIAT